MTTPSNRTLRGKWRRRLFVAWVAASAAIAAYVAFAAPLAAYFGEGLAAVGIVVPALMVFMLATGLGWLVLLVTSDPDPARRRLPD
ncbi:MAG: hypothetical protein R3F55_08875 [Alphaproteobacteria bacterium]